MNIFIDTNICLDITLQRSAFLKNSLKIFENAATKGDLLILAPHSLAIIFYISAKTTGTSQATNLIRDLIELVKIGNFTHEDAVSAIEINQHDYEDSLIIAAAISNGAECIITRNPQDFSNSPIKVFTPEEFLKHVK